MTRRIEILLSIGFGEQHMFQYDVNLDRCRRFGLLMEHSIQSWRSHQPDFQKFWRSAEWRLEL
jgi:hypothetical protein